MAEIVGLGVCCEDQIGLAPRWPKADEGVHLQDSIRQCGGMVATALAAASRLGVSTAFLGMAGKDASGRWLKQQLEAQGVDTSEFILRPGFSTPISTIIVEQKTGQRRIFHYRPVEFDLTKKDVDLSVISKARFLHLDGHYLDLSLEAAQLARKHKVKICLDASFPYSGMDCLFPWVDYLICNRHFPSQMTGQKDMKKALNSLAQRGLGWVVVTLGSKGGLYLNRGRFESYPAFPVNVIDSTGAGDVFHGAFLAALCRRRTRKKAIQYAAAAAALSCQALGGQGALPTHEEVMELIRQG